MSRLDVSPAPAVVVSITTQANAVEADQAAVAALERLDRAAKARKATKEGRELLWLYEAASGEPDLAKRYALRARIAGILGQVLSAVHIEAATRTVSTWPACGIKPEQDDLLTLIAVCGHVELCDATR